MLLIKVPTSLGALNRNRGTEKAPHAIVEALKSDMVNERGQLPVYHAEEVHTDSGNIKKTHSAIYKKALSVADRKPVFLGGDHSITYSTFRAFAERHENPGLLVFDAHPDLMEPFEHPTHDTYLRNLIHEGIVDPENVIIVGSRVSHTSESGFMQKHKIKNYAMKELTHEGLASTCDAVMAAARGLGSLYLSIDIDVVDPAFAPGTGYNEPGGLSSRELIYFLQRISMLKNLKALDLVEVNPEKDRDGLTVQLASTVVRELS
jgi:arginase family enzyme